MAWSSGGLGSREDIRHLLQGGNTEMGSWGEEMGCQIQDRLCSGCLGTGQDVKTLGPMQ